MSNQLAAAVRFLLAASGPKTGQQYECWKSLEKALAAHEAAKPAEPVYYEFRPVSGDGEWRRVKPRDRVYSIGEVLADIRAYHYEGKPCYEIRALYAAPVAVASPKDADGEALRLATEHRIQLDYGGTTEGLQQPGQVVATYPRKRTAIREYVHVKYLPESISVLQRYDSEGVDMARHYLDNYPGEYVFGLAAAVREAIKQAAHGIKEQQHDK